MNVRRIITVAVLTAAAGFAIAGCAGATTTGTPTTNGSMNVAGTLTLHKSTDPYGSAAFTIGATGTSGVPCTGADGYSDIESGASVTIYDATGTIVGIGHLDAGAVDGSNGYSATVTNSDKCQFPFTVANVPTGSSFYQYEITHRGRLTFTPAEAQSLGADLNNN